MKKISMILGSALMMLTVGCTTDTTKEVVNNDNKVIIGLSVDDTRTSLGDKSGTEYPVLWSAGDKVAVNGVASEPLAAEYAGKTAAQFTVTGVAAPFDVIYPADVLMADGKTVGISEIQEYVPGSFAQGSAVMVGHSDSPNGVIKNLYGFVKVPILKGDEKTVKSVTLHSNNLEAMTGTFAVDYVNAALEPLSGMDFVKVTAAEGIPFVEDKAEVVIAVPAGTYANGFTVKIVATDGTAMTAKAYTANGITIDAGTLLAMPEVQFYPNETVSEITDAAQLQAFLSAASAGAYDNFKNENGEVLLGSDIDMTGVTLTSATQFDGVFNGQGYALKNWKSDGTALFAQINAGAVVKNVMIDESCEMNVSTTNAGNKGFIANYNLGTISGCANDAPIVLEIETATAQYMIGAIVGLSGSKSEALVTNCVNNGDMTITIGSMTASSYYFGGVVGDTSGKANTVCMSNCINNGDITVNIDGANGWKNVYLGGCSGAGNNNGVISDCTNNGKIDFYLDKAYKGAYPNIGGITGYAACHINGCKNTGDVSIRTNTYKASDAPQITRPAIGGIAGYVNGDVTGCENLGHILLQGTADVRFQATTSYDSGGVGNMGHPVIGGVCGSVGYPIEGTVTTAKTRTIKDCTNYGTVELINPASTTWAPIGGVVGLPTGTIANCTNAKGAVVKVTMGSTQTYCGGVYGCTVNKSNTISDCANYGKVWFAASNAQALGKQTIRSYAGGISGGYQAGSGNPASNCVNEGEVLAEAANTTMIVAGLFAAHNGTITDCTNNGSVTVKNALALEAGVSEVGGIVGYVNGDLTNCSSYGTITNDSDAGTDTGAIIGAQGGAKTVQGGTIDCTIVAPDSNVGIILGSTRKAANVVTLGAADAPIVISTKTTINGVAVTAADAADANKLAGILRAGSLTITNVVVE
jgi:lipoprotein